MKLFRKYPLFFRGTALFLVFSLLGEIFYPTYANALTSGPASPEFTSFEPVSTTNMVDPFTGNFTYNLPVLNIPGADGGGYAMSLSYHSGATPEEEASWVGYGWTMNAGAINRGKVGYPDEFENVSVKKYNKMVPNWTVSAVENINLEIVSQDEAQQRKDMKAFSKNKELNSTANPAFGSTDMNGFQVELGYSQSVRYNNYTGILKSQGFSVGHKGMASLNMNFAAGNTTFGFTVNPQAIISRYTKKRSQKLKDRGAATDCEMPDKIDKQLSRTNKLNKISGSYGNYRVSAGMSMKHPPMAISPTARLQYPGLSMTKTYGKSFNFSGSIGVEVYAVGVELGYSGNANVLINEPETELLVNGYMHTPKWEEMDDLEDMSNNVSGDYFIENETNFKKTTRSLGIPFGGADAFSVSGEGVGGGFRLHHATIPHYYQTGLTNREIIQNIGVEFAVGQTIAVGLDVGFGWHRTQVDNWKEKNRQELNKEVFNQDNDVPFFQFMNDPGTCLRYFPDGVRSMKFENQNKKIGDVEFGDYGLFWDSGANEPDPEFRQGASSYIEYNMNGATNLLDKMTESEEVNNETSPNFIREIKVTKPNGSKYIYGVSVVAKNEKSLSVGLASTSLQLKRDFTSSQRSAMGNIEPVTVTNDLVYSEDILKNQVVVGEENSEPYATSYLLTQIVSPDYIDINANGPDERDYGGWTKFTYRKKYSVDGEMYRHRAPYTGVYYNRGRMTHNYDQMGQFSTGEKEVAYMKTIETKTHIACFITNKTTSSEFEELADNLGLFGSDKTTFLSYVNGSGSDRYDGMDSADPTASGLDKAAQGEAGTNQLDKLEKIVLFSKERMTLPVSTTHFEYSYELCKGIPNSAMYQVNSPLSGKLTLKKVWTDTEGLSKARIAPYKFEYNYPDLSDIDPAVLSRYGSLFTEYQGLNENPDYREGYLDSWGNYQDLDISENQRKERRSWSYQGELPDDFDPAAWALKKITLPSGGEIQIQYEQKDYTHVQDKLATTMVSIDNNGLNENGYKYDENKYYINLEDVGVDPLDAVAVKDYYVRLASQYFDGVTLAQVNSSNYEIFDGDQNHWKKKMLYFKFLVNYTDNTTNFGVGKADDYVEGYCPVNKVGLEGGNKIYFSLGGEKGDQKYLTPRRITYEQAKSMSNMAMDVNDHFSYSTKQADLDEDLIAMAYDGSPTTNGSGEVTYSDEIKEIKNYLLKNPNGSNPDRWGMRTKMGTATLAVNIPSKSNIGNYFKPSMSHFKLVVPDAKRGGGIRVKRLLMYNPGIENGEASLYGSEYIYETKSGKSSGVATNEPGPSRIESALVDILDKYKQSTWNKLLAGRDKSWAEGPLGEHLLPQASVGHSRVVIKNIHSGRSSAGFVISEYLTCKDHPTVTVEQTELQNTDNNNIRDYYKKAKFSIPLGLFNYSQDMAWLLQGYLFTVDDKHGLLARSYTYNGNYSDYLVNPQNAAIYAKAENTYSDDDNDVISGSVESGDLVLRRQAKNLGEEEDVAMHAGRIEDRTFDFNIELDLNFLIQWPPVMTFGFGASIGYEETELSQHVTSRVIRKTTKLKKALSYADGITTVTENVAYSDLDGTPLITKVSTAYDSPNSGNYREYETDENVYYSMKIPAPWVYETMGKKSVDPDYFNLLTASMGSISTHMENPMNQFTGDDEWRPYTEPIEGIVSAQAVEFRKNRFDDFISDFANGGTIDAEMSTIKQEFMLYDADVDAAELAQMNAFYYPVGSYTFIGDRTSANLDPDSRVYNAGTIKNFAFFNWGASGSGGNVDLSLLNPSWQSPSYATKFSPHGQPLEEVNLLGVYSSVHFGYNNILPTISGINAEYETILFEDYETVLPGASVKKGHTGAQSLDYVSMTDNKVSSKPIKLTQRLYDHGGRFKIWVRLTDSGADDPLFTDVIPGNPKLMLEGESYPLKKIAKVGEWVLLRTDITDWGTNAVGMEIYPEFHFDLSASQALLIDDACFHPLEAAVSMTVYNPVDLKVAAQIGDQHFATIFEYDSEGQLVRTVIETERGRKTVKEQQVNMPKTLRND